MGIKINSCEYKKLYFKHLRSRAKADSFMKNYPISNKAFASY